MDPSKFSSQFQEHLDSVSELGFKFNEDATMVHLPTGQPMMVTNFRTHQKGFTFDEGYQESAMDLNDEGGRVGSLLIATGEVPDIRAGKVPFAAMRLNKEKDGGNDVERRINWSINVDTGEPQVSDLFSTTGTPTEQSIAEHVDNAGRTPDPMQHPGRVNIVDTVSPGAPKKSSISRNRLTGNWEQVPD
jgi:hypothetical protein